MGTRRAPLPSSSRLARLERDFQAAKDDGIDEVVEEFLEREQERIRARLIDKLKGSVAHIQTPDKLRSALESARREFQLHQLGLEKNTDTIEFLSLDHFIDYYQGDKHHLWLLAVNKIIKGLDLKKSSIAVQMKLTSLSVISRKFSRKKGRFTNEELTELWAILFPSS